MPREVELRLSEKIDSNGLNRAQVAKLVGVGEATITAYCKNRWTVLDRTVLEKLADLFQCEPTELLVNRESGFFEPFRAQAGENPECVYLRRPDAKKLESGRAVGHRDNLAMSI